VRPVARSTLPLLAALLALAAAACGSPPRPPPAPAPAPLHDAGVGDAASGARDPVASIAELVDRGAAEAPLMRVAMRLEKTAPRSDELRAERDLCVRAAFAASAVVRVSFVDASGARRGEAAPSTGGMVPPQGPLCVKKGEALRVVVDGAAPDVVVRAVVLAAP
jgi:hypothetical protein